MVLMHNKNFFHSVNRKGGRVCINSLLAVKDVPIYIRRAVVPKPRKKKNYCRPLNKQGQMITDRLSLRREEEKFTLYTPLCTICVVRYICIQPPFVCNIKTHIFQSLTLF